jgi:predicted lipase
MIYSNILKNNNTITIMNLLFIIAFTLILGNTFSIGSAYDEDVARHCVDLSQASYSGISDLDSWTCKTCDQNVELDYVVEECGVRALQGYDSYSDSLFIAFRGSVNIQNWIDNIQISKITPYNDTSIGVSKGFYNAYNSIKPELFDNLANLVDKYNTRRILITGHSLGAAISTLMAYDIVTMFPTYKLSYVINFGSPRVGNSAFSTSFNSYSSSFTHYRITHYYDIVPHVPEEFLGYEHVSDEIWYNEENGDFYICNDATGEDNSCSNSCSPRHCTSTSDHLDYLNVIMGSGGTDIVDE